MDRQVAHDVAHDVATNKRSNLAVEPEAWRNGGRNIRITRSFPPVPDTDSQVRQDFSHQNALAENPSGKFAEHMVGKNQRGSHEGSLPAKER